MPITTQSALFAGICSFSNKVPSPENALDDRRLTNSQKMTDAKDKLKISGTAHAFFIRLFLLQPALESASRTFFPLLFFRLESNCFPTDVDLHLLYVFDVRLRADLNGDFAASSNRIRQHEVRARVCPDEVTITSTLVINYA